VSERTLTGDGGQAREREREREREILVRARVAREPVVRDAPARLSVGAAGETVHCETRSPACHTALRVGVTVFCLLV
jgi:hypothetical protein